VHIASPQKASRFHQNWRGPGCKVSARPSRGTLMLIACLDYFAHMSAELFLTLVDRRLLEMMPDLVTMRHVHLDACMLLIYYAILWQGCFLPGKRSFVGPDRKYARQLYLCCLRIIPSWQRESGGSVTDLVAALYMVGWPTPRKLSSL
jgi:hypothetical protein